MKRVYDWDKNILEITDKYKNSYYLELRGNKNIIKGNSGTGKTFLCDRIDRIKKQKDNMSQYDVENIVVLNTDNIDKLPNYRNKLIIIDEAELLLSDKDVEIINTDNSNRYLIISRCLMGIDLTPNHQADLVLEDGVTKLKYRFNVKGWC